MKRLFETWHQGEGPGSRSYASSTGPQQTFLSGISRPQPSDCLIPGLPSSNKEYTRTAFRYPGVYPDCLQVPKSIPGLPSGTQEYIPGLPSGTQEYTDMHARHLGSEISDCGVVVGPGSRETIPNQGVALVHGQGSLAHE